MRLLIIDRSSHKKLTLILLLLLAVLVFISNKQDENAPYNSNSPHHKSPEYAQKFYDRTLSLISSGYERISSYSNKVCDSNNWGSTSNVWILETMVRHSLPTLLQCTLESYASKYSESCIRVLYLNSNSSLDLVRANLSLVLNRHFNNIELVHMTAEELFKDTPVESLMPNISKARYKAVHISDIARVVLIYKYGGVYSDADIILRRKPEFGSKFFTRSGASGMLINAAFAYPKGDSILWSVLHDIKKYYEPKGYTLMYTHNKMTERYCRVSCDVVPANWSHNLINFKCCDLTVVASGLGQCGRPSTEEDAEKLNCTFYHYSRSYNCVRRNKAVVQNMDLRTDKSIVAEVGRKHCPIIVDYFNYFNITCEDVT